MQENYEDLLVDFSDCCENVNTTGLYDKKYDEITTRFYRTLRESKLDVIMQDNTGFNPDKGFKFVHKWDPYTGERQGRDPYGPLYFHPDNLIYYFNMNKLNMLWIDETDENNGVFQGYYGDAVGAGDDMFIKGRGTYSERYLFRLPVTNCYMEEGCDMSIPVMGPKLTDEEVEKIDDLAEKYFKNNYKEKYGKRRPSLKLMKSLYDQAISKNPDLTKLYDYVPTKKYTEAQLTEFKNKANRVAVDALRKM